MAVPFTSLADRDQASTPYYDRTFTLIANRLQRYIAMDTVLRKERTFFDGGTVIERRVMTTTSDRARFVQPFELDSYNATAVLQKITIPWTRVNTNYMIGREEIDINAGDQQIVDLRAVRRADAFLSLAEKMEQAFWTKPDTSADVTTPWGVGMAIVPWLAGTTNPTTVQLSGQNPVGFTSGYGGLSSTTYDQWRNYSAKWAAITKADLVYKMRDLFLQADFRAPIGVNPAGMSRAGRRYGIYCRRATKLELEVLVEGQNDKLGFDLYPAYGMTTFYGVPLEWVPQLESYSTLDPVYFIDWENHYTAFRRGWFLLETGPRMHPLIHTATVVDVDLMMNWMCVDRRTQGVLTKVSSTGTSS